MGEQREPADATSENLWANVLPLKGAVQPPRPTEELRIAAQALIDFELAEQARRYEALEAAATRMSNAMEVYGRGLDAPDFWPSLTTYRALATLRESAR